MRFAVIATKAHTHDDHGRKYGAAHTVTTTYKHPKDLLFTHVHNDASDCEDSYKYETVTIGDTVIEYSADWGNMFMREYIYINIKGKNISCVMREEGAVNPLRKSEEHRQEGREIFKQLAADFDMSPIDFALQCASTFKININVLRMYC